MKKRTFLLMPIFLISACNTPPAPIIAPPKNAFSTSQLGQDITLAANGIIPVANSLQIRSDLDLATKEKIISLLSKVQSDTKLLLIANGQSISRSTIQEIITSINAILNIAASLVIIPEPYLTIIQALAVILPLIETEAGFAGGGISNGKITGGNTFITNNKNLLTSHLTQIQARLILEGASTLK